MGLQGRNSLRSDMLEETIDMLEETINCEIRSVFANVTVMEHDHTDFLK